MVRTIRRTKAVYATALVISAVALLAAAGVDAWIQVANANGLGIGFGTADDIRPLLLLHRFLLVSFVAAVVALAAYVFEKRNVRRSVRRSELR